MSDDDVRVEVYTDAPPIVIAVEEPAPISIEVFDGLRGRDGGEVSGYVPPLTFSLSGVSSYTATHSFPYYPQVRLLDINKQAVDTDTEYPSSTQVHVVFPSPFSGTLILQ